MSRATPIRLQFAEDVIPSVRARMDYAFRIYAAIYGHRVVCGSSSESPRTAFYGGQDASSSAQPGSLHIPALYQPDRASQVTNNLSRCSCAGEEIFLFYGLDRQTRRPDWLGEIFEWISGGHEQGISSRDRVGRIPDAELIFARQGIPAWKPYVSILLAWLENCLMGVESQPALPKASSPVAGVDHLVVVSHDVDFYFTNRASALHRLVKNLVIAIVQYKNWDYLSANSAMIARLLMGEPIGQYLPKLIDRLKNANARSTFFVVPQKTHRRDPNYSLGEIAAHLKDAERCGFPIEIHGPYTSSIEARTLLPEAAELAKILHKRPTGNRQHWLRFDNTRDLFRTIAEAGLRFDSSVGFTDHVGFRSGASFAFPPYNFNEESAYDFLEIPLAIMDGSLVEESRERHESPQFLADRVLTESRRWGWGGISILWHNPVEALPVPESVNRVFWNCAANKESFRERWVSTDDFFSLCLRQYQEAGLLTRIRIPEIADKGTPEGAVRLPVPHSDSLPKLRYKEKPVG